MQNMQNIVKTLEVALLFEIDEATFFSGTTLRSHMFYISLSATRSLSVLTGLLDQLEAEEIAAEQDAKLQGSEEEDE